MSDLPIKKNNSNMKNLEELIELISNRRDALPFQEPVDYVGLGLTDYPLIVKQMMDLGTVSKKLENREYSTVRDCLDDLQLIWDNCKLYNAEFSSIYKVALRLEEFMQKQIETKFGLVEYGKNNHSYKLLNEELKPEDVTDE